MGNELIVFDDDTQQDLTVYKPEDVAGILTDFLPRLQLMIANSEAVKKGEFSVNHFALVTNNVNTDLGGTVDILPLAYRPKALDMNEPVRSVFDPKHPDFDKIKARSFEKDSMCMFGIEFLVWVPAANKFATFFCGSKSSRREAPNILSHLRQALTLKPKFVDTGKYSWYTPIAIECSTPFDLPEIDAVKSEIHKFTHPPQSVLEEVDEEDTRER